MVKERKEKGYENTYNAGKFVDQGISDMQRDVRNAIDIKAKEIGKPVLSQYLNLNEQLKKTPETAREYPQLVADYQKFNQAHPDIAEYESLVNKFWALDSKSKEARKNPAYKDYYANLDKREQAQANADIMDAKAKKGIGAVLDFHAVPAVTKELFDLGTGLTRAAAGMQRWITGSKYSSLDNVVENLEQVADPNNYAFTATPSNRTQLTGQKYAEVGDFKVLFDGDKVMGVVTKDGGYKVRDQSKVDQVMAAYERDKPKIKTQAINLPTAFDVVIGGATQLGLGMTGAGLGGKLGSAGSMISNFGSKATTIATNAAGTYNKLYNSAIQELGASNQKAAERYAGIAAMGMSMIGTLVNPLEQQLLGQIQKQSIRSLAKELSEGVAEQTAVRNATRMLLTGIKTIGKEGVVEGATEALLDDAIKFGVNKTMLKDEPGFEIDLPQDIIDNVAEETIGGLFGSVAASLNPSTLQQEAITNAFKSPNRAQILAKLDKKAAKHYETVFAKAELTGRSPVDIHKEELVKAKTGEEYVAPAQTVPAQEEPGVVQPVETPPVQDERSAIVKDIADQIDLKPGQKITTPMGQTATIIGFDVDESDEDGEGAANNYLIRMDESGEETVVSIADYNKRVYEQGISQLQAQGMDRNEAEFAIEAARSVRGLNVTPTAGDVPAPNVEPVLEPNIQQATSTPAVSENINPVAEPEPQQLGSTEPNVVQPPLFTPAQLEGKKVSIDGETGFVEKVGEQYYLNNGEELLAIDDDQVEANIIESSPKGIRPNANRIGGQFSFKGETGTLGREGDTFTLTAGNKIYELQPDDTLVPVNDKYIVDVRDNDNATVNGVDYRIVTNESGNVVGLSPTNNPDQVITNERMAVAVEIKRNATVFNENKSVTPEEYKQEKRQNPALQTIENILTVGMTEEISQSIDRLYNEEQLSDDDALNLDYWIDGRIKALSDVQTPEAKQATQNLQTLKSTIYATTGADGSRTGSKGKKKVGRPKKDKPLEERVTPEDIALAQKLLGQAKSTLRGSIEALGEKVVKALKKYGDVKVVIHETNAEIREAYKQATGKDAKMTGFYSPKTKTIHVSLESGNPAHTMLHEALHVFMRGMDEKAFNKLFDELVSIPEYTQVLKTKGRSPAQHAAMYPERWQKEEALVEYFAAIASGEIPVKKDSKVIQILNKLLKMLGFEAVVDNTNIRFIAEGLATALREGIEIERFGANEMEGEVAQEIMVDFPYYDEVAKLVELGLQKGLAGDKITQGIQNAFTAQGITADPNVINAVYQARSATFRKSKPITNKVLAKVKEIHSKLFVAMGGGKIREFSERLDGTIQRYVEQVNALISVAEKQSKGVDQDLVDRFLRDENSADEKQVIVDELRKAGFDEKNLDQYQRRGTTRFQRSAMVQQFTEANPNTTPETDAALQQFIDSKMNTTDRDKVPDNLAETLTTMRMQIDNLSQYLIDEGYVVGERQDVIEKNLGQYMSDVYGIFKDKKFNPTKAAELKARKYFIEQIKNDPDKLAALAASGGNLDEEITKAAIKMVNDYIVKSKVSAGSFNAGTGAPVGKKSESIFKKKEGVPDELKDLLGKYSPLQEYAYTMYKLVSYVEKSKFQRRLVNMGKGIFMWDKNDPARPEDANYELKGFASAKLQGDVNPLKGMMATKEVYDVLNGLDDVISILPDWMKGFVKFQGAINKAKTVYSYVTHFGNVIGNFFFAAFNGMLDVSTFTSFNKARKGSQRDFGYFWKGYGSSNDEVEQILTLLKDEGVVGNEISIRAIRDTVSKLEKMPGKTFGEKIGNGFITADKFITEAYQAEDSFFKILAYLTERRRYSRALFGQNFEKLSKVEQEEVNRIATDIAKNHWPNYGRMGNLTKALAKNNIIFGNFLSFTFEAMRTYANTIATARKEMLSPNKKVKVIGLKRISGVIAGSFAADAVLTASAKLAGTVSGGLISLIFDDKDDTKLNRDLRIGVPKFLKGGDLMFTKVNTSTYRVKDISAKNPLLVFKRHITALAYTPSDEEMATAISTQFLEAFFSKPIATKYIDNIRENNNGKGDKIWLGTDSGTEKAEKIFEFTLKTIAPSSIASAQKLFTSETPGVIALNQISGMTTYEIDYEWVWKNKIGEYSNQSGVYRTAIKELKKAATDDTVTDREFKEALKEFNETRKMHMDKLMEIRESMHNIMTGKEGEKIIFEVINEASLSKHEKTYLKTGKWNDYAKSRSELEYK
jgi:Arc/MetJ-type ribon-helix-helix transcriptional regulator